MNKHLNNELQIGWASRDVTPDKPVNLQGLFRMRISPRIKDPLCVTALALSGENATGPDHVVFLSGDMAYIPITVEKHVREMVEQKVPGLDVSQIIIHGTHTHTAPCMEDGVYPPAPDGVMTYKEYADFFAMRATEAIIESWTNRQAAKVAWGLGQAVVGRNRRAVYFDDLAKRPNHRHIPGHETTRFARMYGNTNDQQFSHIEGYEDHNVDILYTFNKNSEPTGVVVNLACPSQETEVISCVSADFWHETRAAIRKCLGTKTFVLPQCSAAGDQSPHLLWYQKAEKRMSELKGIDSREEIARRIARTVEEVLLVVRKDQRAALPLRHIVKTIQLPRRMITDTEVKLIRADIATLEPNPPSANPDPAERLKEDSSCVTALNRCRLTLARYEQQAHTPAIAMELHVIRLGDIAWVTFPFEAFLDYGLRIKARSPALQTFAVQIASAGAGWGGNYLPSARAELGENYSANVYCNSVGSQGGQVLVNEALRILEELWTK